MMDASEHMNTLNTGGAWKAIAAALSIAGGWLLAYVSPVQNFLITVAVLVLADVVTGIWAARKRGVKFTSTVLKRTVNKIVFYPLAILLSHQMTLTFFTDFPVVENLTYMVSLFICVVEFQSNIENIGTITGIDIWTRIKEFIGSKLSKKPTEPQPPAP